MPKHPKEPREPGAALLKFTPGAVMLRAGISKKMAGEEGTQKTTTILSPITKMETVVALYIFSLLFAYSVCIP